ncbi:MAG: type IV pilus modification protein PilV [Gammaproteobacteria bacterium]|nr:type IV pilus modification protein PilV [Gammaproteobacteria bacterium]
MFVKSAKAGRSQRGDTMIEVLVTIIILAVGVLGAAALQVTTLKNLSSSHSASIAAIVAEDFSERMRANPVEALNNAYVHNAAPGAFTDCAADACSLDDLATYDMGTWWQQVTAVLPSGTGQVTRNAGTNTFVLTIRWDDDRSGSSGTNCPTQSTADLECYQFNVTI